MKIIEIKNLSYAYSGNDRKALQNIDISIDEGEFVLLSGLSGSGKSTLLRLMKKELMPAGRINGSIKFKGTPIHELDDHVSAAQTGFVMQNPDMQPVTDTVWHELAFGLENLGMDSSSIKKTVAETASYFGINRWYRNKISELSGGQKQLVNLASVMAMKPHLLILDEPTSQLDPIAAADFISIVKKLNAELGITVIMAEHQLDGIMDAADRIVLMDNGKIIYKGRPSDIGSIFSDGKYEKNFYSMPSSIQIFYGLGAKGECPLSSGELGRFIRKNYDNEINIYKPENDNEKTDRNENIISVRDIRYRYSRNSDDIIRGIDLNVKKSEFLCLLGGNGAGKTTLVNIISGILKAYRGTVTINGKNIGKIKPLHLYRNNIASLPQNPQLVFSKDILREDLREMTDDTEFIKEITDMMGIGELLDRHPFDLSGGEQQKAALAKILLQKPRILLLDEATKGMDSFYKNSIGNKLRELCANGMTVIMSTHDLEFAARFADRCALIFDGECALCEKTREFFSGNDFYTTSAAASVRGYYKNILINQDVVRMCRINEKK